VLSHSFLNFSTKNAIIALAIPYFYNKKERGLGKDMLITRECDYAVRIVRALSDGRKKKVETICKIEHVPQPYAYKILKRLEKNEIVKSYRGALGGYALARPSDQLNLADIYSAIEDMTPINACLKEGFECPNNTKNRPCGVHLEFDRVQTILLKEFQRKTLAELFQK